MQRGAGKRSSRNYVFFFCTEYCSFLLLKVIFVIKAAYISFFFIIIFFFLQFTLFLSLVLACMKYTSNQPICSHFEHFNSFCGFNDSLKFLPTSGSLPQGVVLFILLLLQLIFMCIILILLTFPCCWAS